MGDAKERVNAGLTPKYTAMLKHHTIEELFSRLVRAIRRSESLGEYELIARKVRERIAVLGLDMSHIVSPEIRDFDDYARERGIRRTDRSAYDDWERNVKDPAFIDAYRDFSLDTTIEEMLDVVYAEVGGAEAAIAALTGRWEGSFRRIQRSSVSRSRVFT